MPPVMNRFKRRRWLRLFLTCVAGILALLALLAWVAVRNVTPLSLWLANRLLVAWQFDAAEIKIGRNGGLDVSDLRVRLRADGSEVLSFKKGSATFTWQELREHRIRLVEIEAPRINGSESAFEEVRRLLASGDTASADWRVERASLRDGFASVKIDGMPGGESRFDAEITSLCARTDAAGFDSLRLRDVTVRSDDGREIATIPEASFEFTPAEVLDGHIRSFRAVRPRVAITQEEAALLRPSSSGGGSPKRMQIDSLSITGAEVRVDASELPRIGGTIDLRMTDFDNARSDSAAPGQLRIGNLSIQPRDSAAQPATLESATIDFTSGELASGRLREVRLVRPSVSLNEAWRNVVAGFGRGGASSTPPEVPFKVDRLVVENGSADGTLPGVPAFKGTVTAELQNLSRSGTGEQTIELQDIQIGLPDQPAGVFREWLRLPKVKITFDLAELRDQRRVKSIELDGPVLRFDRDTRAMFSKVGDTSPSPANTLVVGEVRLRNAVVAFDDLGLGIPPQKFSLNLNLTNVPLNDPLSGGTSETQTLELSNIHFVSPLDPFVPVLALPSVFIQWTPEGLRNRRIEEVILVAPTLHIGPDLFWYLDLVERNRAAPATPASPGDTGPAWRVGRFEATSGKLVLAMTGQSRLTLPMPFESRAENLDFQRLSDLRLNLVLEVPEQDYENSALDIHLRGVSGKIDFKLPPGSDAENVVQTLKVRDIRWRDFRGTDWWLGLTFDERGIHADGGGKMCSGDIRAGFTFFLDERAPWTGWLSGSRLDLKEITDKLAPGRASMNGRASATLAVNGTAGEITRLTGDFRVPGGGDLRITKLDDLIAAIPEDWEYAKRDLAVIGLRSLRDFPFRKGGAAFWLTEQRGQLNVRLDGNLGSRELEVNFNPVGDLNRILMFSPFTP
jgi:hypothetical protein